MGTHSRFSPSSLDRVFSCPGSLTLSESMPEETGPNVAAAEGTAAHFIAELCLKNKQDVIVYENTTVVVSEGNECRFKGEDVRLSPGELEFVVDDEMCINVQEYVDWCSALPGHHAIEFRADHTDWCPEFDEHGIRTTPQYGRVDHVACAPGQKIVVSDLKYGKGVEVFAKENKQAIMYALGAWKEFDWAFSPKKALIRICQPRLNNFDEWEVSIDELLTWGREIKERVALAVSNDPPFNPSEKACRFCRAASRCTALQKHLHEVYASQFENLDDSKLLTDQELVDAYKKIPLFRTAAGAIEKEILGRLATGGGELPGLKLVETRARRSWRDSDGAQKFMENCGVAEEKIMVRSMVSPAQAEKLLPKSLWRELKGFQEKGRGRPSIALEDDPRPAYKDFCPAEGFEVLDEG